MLLRMYLSPLAKDNDEEELPQDDFEISKADDEWKMNIPDEDEY